MKKLVTLIMILTLPFAIFMPSIAFGDPINLALNKPAKQSSISSGGLASYAVDGNTNGNYGGGSVTHTDGETNPWWEVDLGKIESINNILIWNRTDCCANRLSNFYVYVSDIPFDSPDLADVQSFYYADAAPETTDVLVNGHGRFVRIQIQGNQYLSLAEVQVLQSSDAIEPDHTAPITSDDAPESAEDEVTVTLTANDDNSGVATTYYQLNNGEIQSGTSILLTGEGVHEIKYWSVDLAGNAETPHVKSVHVLAPTLVSLSLSDVNLEFHKDITLYTLVVPSDLSSLTLTPVAANNQMAIEINGEIGSASAVSLATGGNKVTIELIDSDGETRNSYTIIVLRPLGQLWDIRDSVTAITAEFDITNDGNFTIQDRIGLLAAIAPITTMDFSDD